MTTRKYRLRGNPQVLFEGTPSAEPATGVTDAAVSFRLGRYGYKPLPPSQQHRTSFQPDDGGTHENDQS